ncbi:GNAT family N-acetyltransferase [Streptomyces sp. PA03-1a]|nr:GNAT family N-acetyltransferase [Streptomyces sp. PA03-1a]MDX2816865.1 GNAT family N-acetyltransferase [Streptomyces sp. PA03-5A]
MTRVQDPLAPVASAYTDVVEGLAGAATGRTRRGAGGTLLAVTGAPVASLNGILAPALEPDAVEMAALAASEPWDVPWSIYVRGVPGAEVTEVAAQYGLTRFDRTPLMIRNAAEGMPPEPVDGSLTVRALGGGELGLYAEVMAEGFEAPYEFFGMFADPAVARIEGFTCYLAEVDGVPVGTGLGAVSGGLTGIFNISTLPEYRRRGYGRAVTMEIVRAGHAAGATTAYLYASSMGESVYASAGFRTEEQLTMISAPPQA